MDEMDDLLKRMAALGIEAQKMLDSRGVTVSTSAELELALSNGGIIQLAPGVYESGRFTISRSGTILKGQGATVIGAEGPALYVPPSVGDVIVEDIVAASRTTDTVVRLGDNNASTQSSLDLVPERITLRRIGIPTFRGKRGIEVNAAGVLIEDCDLADIWDAGLRDSQAIAILNTPGPVTIRGGAYNSGSENIMIGGDTMKLPTGTVPSDIMIDGVVLYKPLSWKTDGINRAVKNLFEVKAGRRVTIRNSTLSGSWKASQDGYAIVITPRNGQLIEGVTAEGLTVVDVASAFQIMGNDGLTPQATSGVSVHGSSFKISQADYGGRGIFALITNGMKDVTVEGCDILFDGNAIVQSDSQTPQGPFIMMRCRSTVGIYGVTMPGAMYGTIGYPGREIVTSFEGNTLADAPSKFKANFPNNTWVTRAELGI